MKKLLTYIFLFNIASVVFAQENYCDFENTKVIHFANWTGSFDSVAQNPAPGTVNGSPLCARYVRDTVAYDNIQLFSNSKLADVNAYTTFALAGPKIKLKVFTSAPVGTLLRIQLGTKNITSYPEGIHSEFIAKTKTQNEWELLTFNYSQSPVGGFTSAADIDKIVLLFNPGSNTPDVFYFDDLMGPALISDPSGLSASESAHTIKLYQNTPNPVKENTHISFQLNSPGLVTLKLYDLLGNAVSSVLEQNMAAGNYSISLGAENIPNGIYIYVLKKEGTSQAMKMVVSK